MSLNVGLLSLGCRLVRLTSDISILPSLFLSNFCMNSFIFSLNVGFVGSWWKRKRRSVEVKGQSEQSMRLRRVIKLTTPAPFRAISSSLKKFSSSLPSMYPFPERQTDDAITTYYQGSRFGFADMQKPHRPLSCPRCRKDPVQPQLNVTIDSNMSLLPVTHPSTLGQCIGLLTNMMQTDHSSKAVCSWSVAQRDTKYRMFLFWETEMGLWSRIYSAEVNTALSRGLGWTGQITIDNSKQ